MLNRVASFIKQHGLLSQDGLHLVALSGGADSVALLLILQELGYRMEAVHCNFHLRGEESDRDEEFVKNLCEERNIPLHLIHFDTKEYALLHKVSIEMAARELRYRYFAWLREDIGADTVCVAHHQDDAVETLLMNLMKGTGIHGLTGIRYINGFVVRPLLCLRRNEIERFLSDRSQSYVTDSSNLQADVLRNKIRLQLMPLIEQILPNSSKNISRTASYILEAEKVFDNSIKSQICSIVKEDKSVPSQTLEVSSLLSLPSPEYFLYEWLSPYGFNATQISQVLSHSIDDTGKVFITQSHALLVDRGSLILEPVMPPLKVLRIPEAGRYTYTEKESFKLNHLDYVTVSKSKDCITIDAEKVRLPLTIRPAEAGDRFIPYGMKKQKLVSDYMTDLKMNLFEKHRQLVMADAGGRIVWVVGRRVDNRFRITKQTKTVFLVSIC